MPELITVLKVVGALEVFEEVTLELVKGVMEVVERIVLRFIVVPKAVEALDRVEIISLKLAAVLDLELVLELKIAVLELAVMVLIVLKL